MRYTLALYCSDLKDSTKEHMPVGVLVVDETARKYVFTHLGSFSSIQRTDPITKAIWESLSEILEQRFEEYCKDPHHDRYKGMDNYHGFISQMIDEWSQASICLSDSMPLGGSGDLEKYTQTLFKEKVLQHLH